MSRKTTTIYIIIGMLLQGFYMQYMFTGTFTSNVPRAELCNQTTK